jgi:hypothetical protein
LFRETRTWPRLIARMYTEPLWSAVRSEWEETSYLDSVHGCPSSFPCSSPYEVELLRIVNVSVDYNKSDGDVP